MEVQKDRTFLKSFLDQEVYRIIPREVVEKTEVAELKFDIQVLGNALSDIAIVAIGSVSVEQIEFLSKILHSIDHSLEDVAFYKVKGIDNNLQNAIKNSPATKVLVFGQDINLGDTAKTILQSKKLSLIMQDEALKRKLWEELKQIF